jgi:large conductance mechanosensitive channel protein
MHEEGHRMKIEEIEGIGATQAAKLAAAGVSTAEELLQWGANKAGRQSLEDTTGISGKLILEWVNHVDLMRIGGVGSEYSDLLEAAGVDSPSELANRNAATLATTFQEVVAARPNRRSPAGSPNRRSCRRSSSTDARRDDVGGFRAFLTKSNALALAIGVIIGASLGSVVTTLVNAVIMPPIGYMLNGVDFASIKTVLGKDGKTGEEIAIGWGLLINSLIVFLAVMLVVYIISRIFIKEEPPPGPSPEEILLTEIRDELRDRAV